MNILIPIFLQTIILLGTSCNVKEASAKSTDNILNNPPAFHGIVMKSDDNGLAWNDVTVGLPEKLSVQAMTYDDNGIYIGYIESQVLSYDNTNPSEWKTQNLKEMMVDMTSKHESLVNGVFSTRSTVYAFAVLEGLFRKKKGQQWLPITTPENVYAINDMIEDENGNIFLSCMNGVYRSIDDGKTWELTLKGGWTGQLLINKGNILVSGMEGIKSSSDNGKTWHKLTINEVNPVIKLRMSSSETHSYDLMSWGEGIAILRSDFPIKNAGSGKFQISMDGGKSWQNHAADEYLSGLEGITSLVRHQGKIYCSYQDGIITSDDDGKTWKSILSFKPSQKNEGIKIIKSGETLYCFRASMGC